MKKGMFMLLICEVILGVFLQSCASTANFKGEGDFCGMVVDERNRPVSGFFIRCTKNDMPCGNAITNESGIFVIQDLKSGKYEFNGRKTNCTDIKNLEVNFTDRKSILCCKVLSAQGVFERADSLIEAGDFMRARKELKTLRCEGGSYVGKMIVAYRALISVAEKDKKSAVIDIRRLKRFRESEFCKFAEELEAVLNGE